MKTSEVFKQCLKHLWDGRSHQNNRYIGGQYICHCIRAAANAHVGIPYVDWDFNSKHRKYRKYPELLPYCNAVQVIHTRMGSTLALDTWLWQKHKIHTSRYPDSQMQKYRRRWLKALIAEFQNLGD